MTEDSKSVQKTKRFLKEAYLELTLEKGRDFSKSVTELCNKAEISRATFYMYYKDMDDFVEKIYDGICAKMATQLVLWFIYGREGLEESTKRKNLVIGETDRELFYSAVKSNSNMKENTLINYNVFNKCKSVLEKEGCPKGIEDINKFDFFFRGYYLTSFEIVHEYSPSNARKDLNVLFDIYDGLFSA